MIEAMALIAAVATATAVMLALGLRSSMRKADSLADVVKSQAVAVRAAQMAADQAMAVMKKAESERDKIRDASSSRLEALEKERVKLLKAGADPTEMAKAWNEVFSE